LKEALARFTLTKKRMKTGKNYTSPKIYLPTKLVNDSAFPFKQDDMVVAVKVKGRRLIIQKATPQTLARLTPHSRLPDKESPDRS